MRQNRFPSLSELLSLEGKTALVTGGAGWLGRAICHTLAELQANVIVASRNFEKCAQWCEELATQIPTIECVPLEMDVTNTESVTNCVASIRERFGGLDILVNNAWSGKTNSWESTDEENWCSDIEVGLTSVFRLTKEVHPDLAHSKGVIINIASMYGSVAPNPHLYEGNAYVNPPSYGAAKAAVIQLTRYLASFLARDGIRANSISPGAFPGEEAQQNGEFMARLRAKNPLGRIGHPRELKGVVALLSSNASSYMTGQNVCVDGGWTIW